MATTPAPARTLEDRIKEFGTASKMLRKAARKQAREFHCAFPVQVPGIVMMVGFVKCGIRCGIVEGEDRDTSWKAGEIFFYAQRGWDQENRLGSSPSHVSDQAFESRKIMRVDGARRQCFAESRDGGERLRQFVSGNVPAIFGLKSRPVGPTGGAVPLF